jgi:hypothetical protein
MSNYEHQREDTGEVEEETTQSYSYRQVLAAIEAMTSGTSRSSSDPSLLSIPLPDHWTDPDASPPDYDTMGRAAGYKPLSDPMLSFRTGADIERRRQALQANRTTVEQLLARFSAKDLAKALWRKAAREPGGVDGGGGDAQVIETFIHSLSAERLAEVIAHGAPLGWLSDLAARLSMLVAQTCQKAQEKDSWR